MDDNRSFFQQHLGGYIAGAAVLAFFTGPLLPLVDPNMLLLEGALFATGVGCLWNGPNTAYERMVAFFGIASLISALALGTYLLVPVANDMGTNARRCVVYEIDMISPKPRWTNSRDLFQALGCRPQSSKVANAQGHSTYVDVQGMPAVEPSKPPLAKPVLTPHP